MLNVLMHNIAVCCLCIFLLDNILVTIAVKFVENVQRQLLFDLNRIELF